MVSIGALKSHHSLEVGERKGGGQWKGGRGEEKPYQEEDEKKNPHPPDDHGRDRLYDDAHAEAHVGLSDLRKALAVSEHDDPDVEDVLRTGGCCMLGRDRGVSMRAYGV